MIIKKFIKFDNFVFRENLSLKISGFSGHNYLKKNKPQFLFTPSKKIETDVVRQFVNKIDFEKFTYIENFSTKIKHSQRSRRIDYILKYYEKIFLIDVIKNNNEKQKVVRKINDQINEIQEITEVILLVNSKVNFNDLIYDSFNPFVIKWSSE